MSKKLEIEKLKKYFIKKRAKLSDSELLLRYKRAVYSYKHGGMFIYQNDDKMVDFVNEIEYRELKYKLFK